MENRDKFQYSYAAPTEAERKEIDGIRRQYTQTEPREESKLDRLRRLDKRVKSTAVWASLAVGLLGCLLFGLGLAAVLEWEQLWVGVPIAVVGALPMLAAYPVYSWILCRNKKRYGEEILRLSEELLQE